jgi:hypothetical protein
MILYEILGVWEHPKTKQLYKVLPHGDDFFICWLSTSEVELIEEFRFGPHWKEVSTPDKVHLRIISAQEVYARILKKARQGYKHIKPITTFWEGVGVNSKCHELITPIEDALANDVSKAQKDVLQTLRDWFSRE